MVRGIRKPARLLGEPSDMGGQANATPVLLYVVTHCLTNPPVGIGGKLITSTGIIFSCSTNQAQIPGLNKIHGIKLQVMDAALKASDHAHHQALIGRNHPAHGPTARGFHLFGWLGCINPSLNDGTKMHFLRRCKQWYSTYGAQIIPEHVRHGRHCIAS
jgi:hypothetical protein